MGVGIAYVLSAAGFDVAVVEPDVGRQGAIRARVTEISEAGVRRGAIGADEVVGLAERLTVVARLEDAPARSAILVEAVPESLELKQAVLARAEGLEPGLLGTNTSSISIDEIASGLAYPRTADRTALLQSGMGQPTRGDRRGRPDRR